MQLERLAKDENSGKSGCPAVYLGEDGSLVVQGQQIDADTRGRLQDILPGEIAVQISPQVVVEALRRYQARR